MTQVFRAAADRVVTTRSGSEILALDLLRALAAVIVLLGHVRAGGVVEFSALPVNQRGPIVMAALAVTRLGHEAVMVFFVLSGFLVGGPLVRRTLDGTLDVRGYAIDRATRILPPLLAACVLTFAVDHLVLGRATGLLQLLGNGVGLNGIFVATFQTNPPLWTIAYEIWFYILAGALACVVGRSGPARLAAFAVVLAATIAFSVLEARYFLFWALGAASSFLLGRTGSLKLALSGWAVAMLGVGFYEARSAVDLHQALVPSPAVSEALICAGVALLLPYCCTPSLNRLLRPLRGPIVYTAGISYTLYLMHFPINMALGTVFSMQPDLSVKSLGMLAARLAILLAVVHVLAFAFEGQTPRLRRYLKSILNRSVPRDRRAAA